MSLYSFFVDLFNTYLDSSQLLGGIGNYQILPHWTDSTKSSGIWTSLEDIQNSKVSKIENKYFGLKNDDASLGINANCFDFWFAAGFNKTLHLGWIQTKVQSSHIMSLFLGCLGVWPPPTIANMLVLWIISMMPMPAPKSRDITNSISSSSL